MAWIDGQFINREQREERMRLIKMRLLKLKKLYEEGKATDYHIELMMNDKDELKRLSRIHRAEHDIAYFAFEYLSDERNEHNDADNIIQNSPNGKMHDKMEDMAPIHREFFDLCDYVDHVETNANLAIASPRGHNKSGTFSNIFPLHQILFRKRRYVLVVSETDTLSKKLISFINKNIKLNEKIRNDFGSLLHPKNTMNEKDNEESFICNDGKFTALVEASSSGKALRGKRFGALRPDCVLVDDPSSMNNEGNKDQRDKLIHWFNSVLMPIGSDATCIILVGTMVSGTGLLHHVLNRKDFKKSFYSAVLEEPKFPDLWQQYCEIYANSSDMEEVDEWYEKNQPLLEQGVKTAWSWRWTYRDLMHAKVNMGNKAYNSEFLNRAYSEDEIYFDLESIAYYRYTYESGRREVHFEDQIYPIGNLYITGAWDLAMGKNARSCYNSVVFIGKHEETGRMFILDEYSSKEQPHIFLNKIVDLIRQWQPKQFGVETIGFQFEMYRQLEERLRIEGIYNTRLKELKKHTSSKETRIESLEPLVAHKSLVFNQGHKILLEQMESYPFGDYVDALDACAMAVDIAKKPKARITAKPDWL